MNATGARWTGWLTLFGAAGFVAIVVALHFLQPEYDACHRLISDLALGHSGWAMLPAFTLLALSLFGVQQGMRNLGASFLNRILLVAAALGMLIAGIFPLGQATEIHVAAATLAFILIVLAMCLCPWQAGPNLSPALKVGSSLLGAVALVSVSLVNVGLPLGIGQRVAAGCVLAWLNYLGWQLTK